MIKQTIDFVFVFVFCKIFSFDFVCLYCKLFVLLFAETHTYTHSRTKFDDTKLCCFFYDQTKWRVKSWSTFRRIPNVTKWLIVNDGDDWMKELKSNRIVIQSDPTLFSRPKAKKNFFFGWERKTLLTRWPNIFDLINYIIVLCIVNPHLVQTSRRLYRYTHISLFFLFVHQLRSRLLK